MCEGGSAPTSLFSLTWLTSPASSVSTSLCPVLRPGLTPAVNLLSSDNLYMDSVDICRIYRLTSSMMHMVGGAGSGGKGVNLLIVDLCGSSSSFIQLRPGLASSLCSSVASISRSGLGSSSMNNITGSSPSCGGTCSSKRWSLPRTAIVSSQERCHPTVICKYLTRHFRDPSSLQMSLSLSVSLTSFSFSQQAPLVHYLCCQYPPPLTAFLYYCQLAIARTPGAT